MASNTVLTTYNNRHIYISFSNTDILSFLFSELRTFLTSTSLFRNMSRKGTRSRLLFVTHIPSPFINTFKLPIFFFHPSAFCFQRPKILRRNAFHIRPSMSIPLYRKSFSSEMVLLGFIYCPL